MRGFSVSCVTVAQAERHSESTLHSSAIMTSPDTSRVIFRQNVAQEVAASQGALGR